MPETAPPADASAPAPPKAKKRSESSAQRRARQKRAAERREPTESVLPQNGLRDGCPATLPDPKLPPTSTPDASTAATPGLHAPLPIAVPSLCGPMPTAASPLQCARISVPVPEPMTTPTPHPPRDVLSLLQGLGDYNPWGNLRRRRRRRRASHPHRHVRQERAAAHTWPSQQLAFQFTAEDELVDALRSACFTALGPLYEDIRTSGIYGASPAPADSYEFTARPEADCFAEIAEALLVGEELFLAGPRSMQESEDALATISEDLLHLRPSVWAALVTVHSFFAHSCEHWATREMGSLPHCYLAGISSLFLGDSGG